MSGRAPRILHLLPSLEYVGALRRIATIASRLKPERFEFRAAVLEERGPDPDELRKLGVRVTALASGRRFAASMAWQLRRTIRAWRPDILHCWHPRVRSVVRLATIASRGIRLIDDPDLAALPLVDTAKLPPAPTAGARAALLAALDLPTDARLLGTAGHLTTSKRVAELLWALDQIHCVRDDVYLLVVGDGEARHFYERYARLYEIDEHVRFLGWRNDSLELLSHLDVYCSAESATDCSLAIAEAMALGVPVVASDTPGHRRLVVQGETGYLAPIEQRSEIARWCLRLLEVQPVAQQMSETSKQRAREVFAIDPLITCFRRRYFELSRANNS
jgi:glycosyltransferase involved in cell wall biosynthesis